jgi:FkbM family methyltransferase
MTMELPLPVIDEDRIRNRFWAPQPGEVVLDIGSCDGVYTLPALAARATVYAVDARADTLRTIHSLAEILGMDDRLTGIHAAIHDNNQYPQGLLDAIARSRYRSSRVMAPDSDVTWMTVDDLVDLLAVDRLDWIKVDVEGGELGVLRGAYRTLRTLRPTWLIEDHSRVYPWIKKYRPLGLLLDELAAAAYSWQIVAGDIADYVIARPQ